MTHPAWSAFSATVDRSGDRIAVRHGTDSASFATLAARAADWSASFAAAPGDRIVLCCENSIECIAATLGIWHAGCTPVWVNADAPAQHLTRAIDQTGAACLVSVNEQTQAPCAVLTVPTVAGGTSPAKAASDSLGSIVYTSGSTGLPKGVMQRADTLIDGATRVASLLGYADDDSILCPVPFAFDYGWGQMLSMAITGISLVLPSPRNAFGICDALRDHQPTVFAGVPAVYANLFNGLSPILETSRDSIRLITNTGSKIPPGVFAAMTAAFPKARISLNYGLTETYRSASLPCGLVATKPHSVGTALPGTRITILRPDGTECAPGETGEVIHQGAGTFAGYWKDPAKTAEVLIPAPSLPDTMAGSMPGSMPGSMAVRTGDLGHIDADGHLVIEGRKDRQIKSMGVRVSPDEIEATLAATGLVAELAVTSRPDDMLGEMVVAFVVPPPGAEAKDMLKALKKEARARLSPFMTPRLYHLTDALPRNANGKIDYPALKQRAAEGN